MPSGRPMPTVPVWVASRVGGRVRVGGGGFGRVMGGSGQVCFEAALIDDVGDGDVGHSGISLPSRLICAASLSEQLVSTFTQPVTEPSPNRLRISMICWSQRRWAVGGRPGRRRATLVTPTGPGAEWCFWRRSRRSQRK